jgi:hypothetical protein
MDTQQLTNGKTVVTYGSPVSYQSPLWITSSTETEIVYSTGPNEVPIGKVYRKDDEWYLATAYLGHWQPVPTFTKYEGFLLLLNLYKQNREY